LTANISYSQEVFHIGHINKLIHTKMLTDQALERYGPIKIRAITMSDEVSHELDYESKLARSRGFIRMLFAHGRERGRHFLQQLDSPDADVVTALRYRNIWGQWTAPVPPYAG
jgi:hypothetical protein